MLKKLVSLLILSFTVTSYAEIKAVPLNNKCTPDYVTTIDSNNECLRLISDNETKTPEELVIYLHGDYCLGGASYMSEIASDFKKSTRLNIALIRPGYFDVLGNFSTGNSLGVTNTKIAGRLNNYTQENIDIIGHAIQNLKDHYKPKRLLIVGHSGGAAIAALLLNEFPNLADGALLINCPCDVKRWRPDWDKSLSPIEHISKIPAKTVVHLIAGAVDDAVSPELSKAYAEALAKKGIRVQFYFGIGMAHNLSDKKTQEMSSEAIDTFLKTFNP